jgi:hypothetical protein
MTFITWSLLKTVFLGFAVITFILVIRFKVDLLLVVNNFFSDCLLAISDSDNLISNVKFIDGPLLGFIVLTVLGLDTWFLEFTLMTFLTCSRLDARFLDHATTTLLVASLIMTGLSLHLFLDYSALLTIKGILF